MIEIGSLRSSTALRLSAQTSPRGPRYAILSRVSESQTVIRVVQWSPASAAPAMFSLTLWSGSKTVITTSETADNLPSDGPVDPPLSHSELPLPGEPPLATEDRSSAVFQRDDSVQPTDETPSTTPSTSDPQQSKTAASTNPTSLNVPEPRPRRISIRSSLSLLRRSTDYHERKSVSDAAHMQQKKHNVVWDFKRAIRSGPGSPSKSERRAKESAEIVRTLIIGPNSISPASKKSPLSKGQLDKVKSELAKPKSANKVISQLRNLDLVANGSVPLPVAPKPSQPPVNGKNHGPIHAVCLDETDEDVEKHHFAQLKSDVPSEAMDLFVTESVVTANMDSINSILGNLHIVDLVGTDFGFGQPTTGQGILAGAVPTAETVLTGIKLLTPQLMSLGYVTGQAIMPDHKGKSVTHTYVDPNLTLPRCIPSDRQNVGSHL